MIKESIHQEVITIINIDAPKNRVLKIHEVQAGKLKREENTITVGDFNIPFSTRCRICFAF